MLEVFLLRVRASMPVYICAPSSLVVPLFWPAKVWRGLHRLVKTLTADTCPSHYQKHDNRCAGDVSPYICLEPTPWHMGNDMN